VGNLFLFSSLFLPQGDQIGEFQSIGQMFSLVSLKNTKVAQIFGLLKSYVLKWATIWAIYLQTHLVTLLCPRVFT
jgi:hypothetical protein